MTKQIVTQKRLKELLHYDPDTGDFTRLVYAGHEKTSVVAGSLDSDGYIIICVDYRRYCAHRLAFLYMTSEWPIDKVDHNDHIRNNNRWSNLNQATYATNSKNCSMTKTNTSGFMGVHWDKVNSKWLAQICVNGKMKNLGRFNNIEDAVASRKSANKKYGFHENHGRNSFISKEI